MTVNMSGLLPILPYITSDPDLSARSQTVLVGIQEIRIPFNARVNLFNLVGDADASKVMLHTIESIAKQIRPVRYFNPAGHIFRTARGRLSSTLANIPGCIMPRVNSVNPSNFLELRAACQQFDSWPMIVRARGCHNGENMALVNTLAELESLKDLSWPYTGIVLTQYIDCRGEDGLYHKARVIMVDGTPYPRHCIYTDQWKVSAGSRMELMEDEIELCHKEEQFLAQLLDARNKEYVRVFQEIHRRIGLDIFGIDFAFLDGQIVIFEANPCMKFLDRRYQDDNRYQYLDAPVMTLKQAIKRMLLAS